MDPEKRNLSLFQQVECSDNIRTPKKSLKVYFPSREHENQQVKSVSKMTQVNIEAWVSEDDLCSEIPTETYWKILAERRRVALKDALKENKRLWTLHETLTQENAQTRQMLDEANSFIEVFKEIAGNSADDTGIDVGDISLVNGDDNNQ